MQIYFQLVTLGWLECQITLGRQRVKISHSSDYGDQFQVLLTRLFDIRESSLEQPRAFSFQVIWCDDISRFHWSVSVDSSRHYRIQIREETVANSQYRQDVIDVIFKESELFYELYLSLHHLYTQFGLIGYKKVWEAGNFPIYEYLTLKAGREHVVLAREVESEDWKQRVPLEQELLLLTLQD